MRCDRTHRQDCLCNAIAGMDVVSPTESCHKTEVCVTDHATMRGACSRRDSIHFMPRFQVGPCQTCRRARARAAMRISPTVRINVSALGLSCAAFTGAAALHYIRTNDPSLPCPASSEYSEYSRYSGATLAKPSAAQCRVNTSLGNRHPAGTAGTRYTPAGTVGGPRAHSRLLLNQT